MRIATFEHNVRHFSLSASDRFPGDSRCRFDDRFSSTSDLARFECRPNTPPSFVEHGFDIFKLSMDQLNQYIFIYIDIVPGNQVSHNTNLDNLFMNAP